MTDQAIIRASVAEATRFPKEPAEMTFRDALEWFKSVVKAVNQHKIVPTQRENAHMNEQWGVLATAVAEREGVPVGLVSEMLSRQAELEFRLVETAVNEAEAPL